MRPRIKIVAFAVLVAIAFFAYAGRYTLGRYLCQNYKDTWMETSGAITCYRHP